MGTNDKITTFTWRDLEPPDCWDRMYEWMTARFASNNRPITRVEVAQHFGVSVDLVNNRLQTAARAKLIKSVRSGNSYLGWVPADADVSELACLQREEVAHAVVELFDGKPVTTMAVADALPHLRREGVRHRMQEAVADGLIRRVRKNGYVPVDGELTDEYDRLLVTILELSSEGRPLVSRGDLRECFPDLTPEQISARLLHGRRKGWLVRANGKHGYRLTAQGRKKAKAAPFCTR